MKLLSFADVHAPLIMLLSDDRPVLLDELIQHRTYRGLLLGLPREGSVPGTIDQAVGRACKHFGDDPAPHVLDFDLIDYELTVGASRLTKDGNLNRLAEPPQTRTGQRLPLVTCIGSFVCPITVKPPNGIGVFASSIATIIWFQESFGPPFGGEITEKIRILDWAAVAVDISD